MSPRNVVHVVGILLVVIAGAMASSGVVALLYGDGDAAAIFLSAAVTAATGLAAWLLTSMEDDLGIRDGYAIVAFSWIAAALAGGIPYLLTGSVESYTDGVFEAMSGFTTTGATVFTEIEALPHGILFWRSLTHWLGGMGIIVLVIAVLPYLGVGGMQLFRAEVPGPTPERLRPRIAQTAKLLWWVYVGMTVVQTGLYLLGGMDLFEATTHTFGTLATGGFSPRNASIAAYESPYIHYVTIVFMYLAGVNFVLHFRAATGRPLSYVKDSEWRFFTGVVVAAAAVLLGLNLAGDAYGTGPVELERAFRDSLFQAASITTTTGYVTADYGLWAPAAQLLLLALMFVGGMAGSTGGSIKAMRAMLVFKHGDREVRKHFHPRAVLLIRIGRKVVDEGVLTNVLGFVLLYVLLFVAGAIVLSLLGLDVVTAIGASAATIGNIGPGVGHVGPVEHYGWLPATAKGVCSFLMLLGRLEIYTVLLLLHPEMWTRIRGRR